MNTQDLQKLASIIGQAIDTAEAWDTPTDVHLDIDIARMVSEALDQLADLSEPSIVRAELSATLDQTAPYRPAVGDIILLQVEPGHLTLEQLQAIEERLRGVFDPATVVLLDARISLVGVTVVDPAELAAFLQEAS